MTAPDLAALFLTLRLALVATCILLVIGTPLAWWLARTRARGKPVIEALVALPLVLPPTVLGFYLLILLNPQSPIGSFWLSMTGNTLTFSFSGLVLASVLYSLPFMVQPLQSARKPWSITLRRVFLGRPACLRTGVCDRNRSDLCAHAGRVWYCPDGWRKYS